MMCKNRSLRQANISESKSIWSLYQEVIQDLNRKEILQWNESYPTYEYIQSSIINKECWIYTSHNQIIASVVLNQWQDPAWRIIPWHCCDHSTLVIHALVVHPRYQGQGLGKLMVEAIEGLALSLNYESIRLDAFSKNKVSNLLYKKLNYHDRGTVCLTYKPLDNQMYHCYEKELLQKLT